MLAVVEHCPMSVFNSADAHIHNLLTFYNELNMIIFQKSCLVCHPGKRVSTLNHMPI